MKEKVIMIPDTFSVEEASQFREAVRGAVTDGTVRFLLDFSGCRFIDSTGLGVIVSSYKKCVEAGGGIRLKSLNSNVRKVFELTRLNNVFEILP
jgi:anti-sigma B factor antagonist